MVDWFPFHGSFRLSGGMTIYNNTGLTAVLEVPTGQSFKGRRHHLLQRTSGSQQPLRAPLLAPASSPSAAIRSSHAPPSDSATGCPKNGHFRFESEIGVQYFSAPTVALAFSGTGCQNYTAGSYIQLRPH